MNDLPDNESSADMPQDSDGSTDSIDERLVDAGRELRRRVEATTSAEAEKLRSTTASAGTATDIRTDAWRRRQRWWVAAAAALAVVSGAAVGRVWGERSGGSAADSGGALASARDEQRAFAMVSALPDEPTDPTKVRLVSTVSAYQSCGTLLDQLRAVGAEHVGSRGFNGSQFGTLRGRAGAFTEDVGFAPSAGEPVSSDVAIQTKSPVGGDTLGTNIQVAGVDEPDSAKAVGALVYDLRGNRLRIIDTTSAKVLGRLDLDDGDGQRRSAHSSSLLVSGSRVVVLGSESISSEPLDDDPSATVSSREYLTITLVDVADPATPKVTDRASVDGHFVAARLVDDEVRLVSGSYLNRIGFVSPTSPESVPTALEANRLAVARSKITDWVPSVYRDGDEATPLVPCDRVYVPDTFAGVSMTSMVKFAVTDRFEPTATGLLAPSDQLYATAERVTIAATVWVDPAVAAKLKFDRWDTALHQFTFDSSAPTYLASTTLAGSVATQFSFGDVGSRLAVVTNPGTPWNADASVNLTLFDQPTAEKRTLSEAAKLADLGDGASVSGVRFTKTRAVVSTTAMSQGAAVSRLKVVDLSDPAAPRPAAALEMDFSPAYLHPITEDTFLGLGAYSAPNDDQGTEMALVVTTNADAPGVTSAWKMADSSTEATADHHAFTWWPTPLVAAFGVQRWSREPGETPPPVAVVLKADGSLVEQAVATPTDLDIPAPCPVVSREELQRLGVDQMIGNQIVLRCGEGVVAEWPGYSCSLVDAAQYGAVGLEPPDDGTTSVLCSPLGPPTVSRVMVVDGKMWLNTSESLERINPLGGASEQVIPLG